MKIRVLILVILISFLTGCMNGTPSENDGKKALKNYISNKAKIVSFIKTNGKKDGENNYVMYFKAEITYPNGLNMECLERNIPKVIANGVVIGKDRSRCMAIGGRVKAMEKGAKETIERKIYFEKTENGWISRHITDEYGL